MSIENSWNQLNQQQDDDLSSLFKVSRLSRLTSNNPLEKIKKNMLMNMTWAIAICAGYLAIILYFKIWQVQLAMTIVLIFSLWALYTTYQEYQKLNSKVSSDNSLLAELRRHHASISHWMTVQQRAALFIYPISAVGGFMLGGVTSSGKPVEVFMSKPFVQLVLLIALIVLVPACYYLARWMMNFTFGKHLRALQENIRELEEEI